MYVVFNIDHIHHLLNELKILNFAYNSDRRVYFPASRQPQTSVVNPGSQKIAVFSHSATAP